MAGYTWAALELDDYGNAPRWPSFRGACVAQGVTPGVWFTQGGNLYTTPEDAGFTIAELESNADYDGIMDCLSMGEIIPPVPRAVVTHFGPIDAGLLGLQGARDKAAPLIEAGFECLTECDMPANPNATPPNLDVRARQLGWERSQPVFYCYQGFTPENYEQWHDIPGWSVYLAEYVL